MARKRRVYDDDDGRTIVDMSGVERPHLILPGGMDRPRSAPKARPADAPGKDRPWEQEGSLTRQERRWYVLGALKAALLIALAFIVGLGLVIVLILLIGK